MIIYILSLMPYVFLFFGIVVVLIVDILILSERRGDIKHIGHLRIFRQKVLE